MDKNREIRNFTNALIAGELNTTFSFPDTDQSLVDSLNKLKDTLVRNRELERKRRLEEKQSNWVAQGLATFGDILRTHSREMETMAYEVVSTLVRYLDANQGAIFILKEEDRQKSLKMIACYAYERRKFPDRDIPWGEGLIGEVAQEKKGYYTDKVPANYLRITSGLGKALPNYLLIEPLVWNERVFGVLELASFKDLEAHARQFVSRVAESIATTIQTMQSNMRTEHLLKETQAQAKQLAIQEEQGRQNMEALRSAQPPLK
jgi:GAF domain-containing protein